MKTMRRTDIAGGASIVGVLFLVLAGLIYLIQQEISPWVFLCVLIGVVGIGLWIVWAPGEFQAWITGRQTRLGTTSLLITILFIGFVVFVYILVDRANITVDLTSRQRYSLNTPSLDAIKRLRDKGYQVRITGFFSRYKLREQESADLLLRLYEAQGNGTIEVEYIDPDERPDVAQRYNYQAGYDGDLYLTILDETGQPNAQAMPLYLGDVNERNITTGLMTVASAGTFKIYFTTGHAEREIEDTSESGISTLAASLIGQGVAVEPLRLLDVMETGIPEDASAVLIVGARIAFTEEEVELIADYMQRGGRLGIFTDPPEVDPGTALTNTFLEEDDPFSEYLWNEFGIRARDAVIIERQMNVGSEFTFYVNSIAQHDILQGLQDVALYMRLTRPLELAEEPQGNQGMYVREPLLVTSNNSYGETDLDQWMQTAFTNLDDNDIPGPALIGATARRILELQEEIQPRLVIIGDSDVIQNDYVTQLPGNNALWSDTVDWLTGFSQAVSFTPISDPTRLPLIVSDQQRNTIAYITMLGMPGLILAAGALVWWYRRH